MINESTQKYTIKKVEEFERVYREFSDKNNGKDKNYFFRGVNEAKFKLLNSMQRPWMSMKIGKWRDKKYRDFLHAILKVTKSDPLFERVMEFYGNNTDIGQFDFSLLSLIQHYSGTTPFLDWTYDLDVALFFAVENISGINFVEEESIDNYFSLYIINNEGPAIQALQHVTKGNNYSFTEIFEMIRHRSLGIKRLFYLSDHETGPINTPQLTTIYNQNIVTQKGLFIFNPSRTTPLEDFFLTGENYSPDSSSFFCYNIRKDLAEYIRKKIASKKITKDMVYPNLYKNIAMIKKTVLNLYF